MRNSHALTLSRSRRLLPTLSGSPSLTLFFLSASATPACGSGHFLLAAARFLGKELARIRDRGRRTGAGTRARSDPRLYFALHLRCRQEPAGRRVVPRRVVAGSAHGRASAHVFEPPHPLRRFAGRRVWTSVTSPAASRTRRSSRFTATTGRGCARSETRERASTHWTVVSKAVRRIAAAVRRTDSAAGTDSRRHAPNRSGRSGRCASRWNARPSSVRCVWPATYGPQRFFRSIPTRPPPPITTLDIAGRGGARQRCRSAAGGIRVSVRAASPLFSLAAGVPRSFRRRRLRRDPRKPAVSGRLADFRYIRHPLPQVDAMAPSTPSAARRTCARRFFAAFSLCCETAGTSA
ncbi:MAG: hypothetical protein KatS3mg082_2001 [Nitrospiraceae bacterium]|nr:MAG: hypothetical protein KatS3mg082_2001 [Nitrospiraceae bacterium]